MTDDREHRAGDQSLSEPTGCLPVLLRTTWLMWGNFALLLCAAFVAQGIAPPLADLLFLLVAAGVIGIRYLDIARYHGSTSDGEPATLAHWRRYAIAMVLVSAVLWTFARVAAARGWL